VENVPGIRRASDVPVGWRDIDEESLIYQRVRSGVPALVDQDVEAFCSRGGGGTVVIGVSERESRDLKMKEYGASIKEGR
jgi:hypothetical protein